MNRVYSISNLMPSWINKHYRIYQDCSSETVIDRTIDHAKMKMNNRKDFEYDTGLKDMFNKPIIELVPTVVILDSLAVMRSGEIDFSENQDKALNNMAAARKLIAV